MSQVSDVVLANQGFASFRTELNNILGALNTQHIGGSAPSSVATGTIWVDSGTSGFLKILFTQLRVSVFQHKDCKQETIDRKSVV